MALKQVPVSHEWQDWWRQAESERQTSAILSANDAWAASCFHALQSIEMALKAIARMSTWSRMARITWEAAREGDWGDLRSGGEQPMEHDHDLAKLLDDLRPWNREPLEFFRDRFQELDGDNWYTTTRYPEGLYKVDNDRKMWQPSCKWHAGFTESDAIGLQGLTDRVLDVIGQLLEAGRPHP